MKINYKKTFKRSITAIAITAVLATTNTAYSANNSSNLLGSVSVNSQSVEGYTVTIKNNNTGRSRTLVTNKEGDFRFSQLPIGTYSITVANKGEIIAQETRRVSLGSSATALFDLNTNAGTEVIEVIGARIGTVDVSTTDSGLILGEADIDVMPIARNITAVTLLAPGVFQGSAGFGNSASDGVASFGGSSVSENSCFINGLEVTNTRQGLGCGSVPFEFYKEFQVKTGGYSAQFGRTTGGVLNAVTKSGSNEFEFAFTADYSPAGEEGRVSRADGGLGAIFIDTRNDEFETFDYTLSASGPIIEDTLFFYALINPRDKSSEFSQQSGSTRLSGTNQWRTLESDGGDNLFWGAKIDWDINENHRLSAFAYSDRNDTQDTRFTYDAETETIGSEATGTFLRERGGEAQSLSYTGYFTDDLTVSAMLGKIETEYTTTPSNLDCPTLTDNRTGVTPIVSCGPGGSVGGDRDDNTQFRLDVEYILGDHAISFGYDSQERESFKITEPITGTSWTYETLEENAGIQSLSSGNLYTNTTGAAHDYVAGRVFRGGGGFSSDLTAWYVEDAWQVTENVILNLGVRQDHFVNTGTTGIDFVDLKTDIAPRLAMSWDVNGDSESKLYANWGRYFLPVPNNTNYRVAAGIADSTTFYTFTDSDSTGAPTGINPITGDITSSTNVNSVPSATNKDLFQAAEADPFFKDEWIIGYEKQITDDYSASIRGVYREVGSALDDFCGPPAPACALVNPGEGGTWGLDSDGDGAVDPGSYVYHSAEEIGLPEGVNEYTAIQSQVNYASDNMRWTFIYSWSRSVGNFEGASKSDNNQVDAGITTDFDFPALMDGSFGYLPNDRRHSLKFFGSYSLTEDLVMGWNASVQSGRPISATGRGYPDHSPRLYGSYGDTYYLFTGDCPDNNSDGICQQTEKVYQSSPRGNNGRTPWIFNLDMSLNYSFEVSGIDMRASLDVVNVLNSQEAQSVNERYERNEGTENIYYGAAYSWQAPRSLRLGFEARF
jgi:hypothetical protein